jgi:hypothetical protein
MVSQRQRNWFQRINKISVHYSIASLVFICFGCSSRIRIDIKNDSPRTIDSMMVQVDNYRTWVRSIKPFSSSAIYVSRKAEGLHSPGPAGIRTEVFSEGRAMDGQFSDYDEWELASEYKIIYFMNGQVMVSK